MKYLIYLSFLFLACANPHMNGKNNPPYDLQGHRGSRGLYPENTIPAMLNAIDLGVITLELDVVVTKDKKVVLSHEPFFSHIISTKPDGQFVTEDEARSLNIYEMTYAEVAQYDVGLKPHPDFPEQKKMAVQKPLLKHVLEEVIHYCAVNNRPVPQFNIETKINPQYDHIYHPGPEEFMELVWADIVDAGLEEKTIIQSFDFRTLQALRKKYPYARTAMLIESSDTRTVEQQLIALGFTPSIYSPAFQHVNRLLVAKSHALGMMIIPWTVNDPVIGHQLKRMGIDGIITDYPDRVR